jgi:hypothetical protein
MVTTPEQAVVMVTADHAIVVVTTDHTIVVVITDQAIVVVITDQAIVVVVAPTIQKTSVSNVCSRSIERTSTSVSHTVVVTIKSWLVPACCDIPCSFCCSTTGTTPFHPGFLRSDCSTLHCSSHFVERSGNH